MPKISQPAKYTAIALILQCGAALAQDAPEPKPASQQIEIAVSGAVCGDPGYGIAGKPGALVLVDSSGAVVLQGSDLSIIRAWFKRCPKKGGAQ